MSPKPDSTERARQWLLLNWRAVSSAKTMSEEDATVDSLAAEFDAVRQEQHERTREAAAYQCRLMSRTEDICLETGDQRRWSDHCEDAIRAITLTDTEPPASAEGWPPTTETQGPVGDPRLDDDPSSEP